MKIKAHIDSIAFKSKPEDGWTNKKLSNRVTETISEVEPAELANLMGNKGHSTVFGLMNGKRNKNNMYSQQVLALDFDNKDSNKKKTTGIFYQSVEETLQDDFIQENASFIYRTFSNEPGWDKFRVVFILDQPFTTNEEVTSAYKWLMEKFPNADRAPKDSSRLFYGGVQGVTEVKFNNILPTSVFPAVEAKVKVVPANPSKAISGAEVTSSVVLLEGEIPTYKLIKSGNVDAVRARLGHYGKGRSFKDTVGAYNFLRSLNMAEVLGITTNPFHDILNYDATPSASIWKPEDTNTYLYTSLNATGKNGNAKSYDIIQIVQLLTGFTYIGAQQYLIEATGVNFKISDKLFRIQEEAELFKGLLLSDTFKEQHPEMHQVFGKYKYTTSINALIDIFKGQLYEYNGEVECLSWISPANIAKRLDISEKKAQRLMNLMSLTKLADKLDDDQIPEQLLDILERNKKQVRTSNGEWVNRGTERERRSNVYSLSELMGNFTGIEERCESLVEKGFTMRGMSREFVLRNYGKSEADSMYPQDKERTISKKSVVITTSIQEIALTEIQKNGYVVINELKEKVQTANKKTTNWVDYKYKQAEAEMLEAYGLKKISLTNQLREEYGITHLSPTARPKILVLEK